MVSNCLECQVRGSDILCWFPWTHVAFTHTNTHIVASICDLKCSGGQCRGLPQIQGQPGLCNKFQASLDFRMRPWLLTHGPLTHHPSKNKNAVTDIPANFKYKCMQQINIFSSGCQLTSTRSLCTQLTMHLLITIYGIA